MLSCAVDIQSALKAEKSLGPPAALGIRSVLPVDLGQQQFLRAVGAVDIAGPQLGGQAVALAVEQQRSWTFVHVNGKDRETLDARSGLR